MNYYWSSGIFCKQSLSRVLGRDALLYERVILALLRLSRDKYLRADYVRDAARKLSYCVRREHWFLTKMVFDDEDLYRADVVGLMRGVVPFQGGEGFVFLRDMQSKKCKNIELKILKLTIKEMKNGN